MQSLFWMQSPKDHEYVYISQLLNIDSYILKDG